MIQDAFIRQRAKQLYWQGYPPAEISRMMGINQNTLYAWKKHDAWDNAPPVQPVSQSIDARLVQLTGKQDKTGGDFKEIDLLTRQLKKLSDGPRPEADAAKSHASASRKTTSARRRLPRCGSTSWTHSPHTSGPSLIPLRCVGKQTVATA